MKDPSLLEATGSEPLSLEEEVEMQQSWRDDPKKCTFIVHATQLMDGVEDKNVLHVQDALPAMVGDVNLFLSEMEHSEGGETDNNNENLIGEVETTPSRQSSSLIQAEIDVMIAEMDFRGKQLGRAATCTMMLFGATEMGIVRFFCKINEDNEASINLFRSLGFEQCNYAACFKQYELELKKPLAELQAICEVFGTYKSIPCPLQTDVAALSS
jgi:Acetyltransferase (GNAT) domain